MLYGLFSVVHIVSEWTTSTLYSSVNYWWGQKSPKHVSSVLYQRQFSDKCFIIIPVLLAEHDVDFIEYAVLFVPCNKCLVFSLSRYSTNDILYCRWYDAVQ